MNNLKLTRQVSYDQVKILIDFMGQHVDFATGSLRSIEARQASKLLWKELTRMLNNSRNGTKKTSDGWSKYWSDFKNKLKNKVTILNKKRSGSSSSRNIKQLSRLEKRALVILGPHFERKICMGPTDPYNDVSNHPPKVKLEGCNEKNHNVFGNSLSENSDEQSDATNESDYSNEQFDEDLEEQNEQTLHSIYPKWLIEIEKKRAEADLARAKAEEKRANIAAKTSEAALMQAEALKKLADAAVTQAEALAKIAGLLETSAPVRRVDILPI